MRTVHSSLLSGGTKLYGMLRAGADSSYGSRVLTTEIAVRGDRFRHSTVSPTLTIRQEAVNGWPLWTRTIAVGVASDDSCTFGGVCRSESQASSARAVQESATKTGGWRVVMVMV